MEVSDMQSQYGLGFVFSLISITVGAIMRYAVTSQGADFNVATVGIILMFVGGFGLIVSTALFAAYRIRSSQRIITPVTVVPESRKIIAQDGRRFP